MSGLEALERLIARLGDVGLELRRCAGCDGPQLRQGFFPVSTRLRHHPADRGVIHRLLTRFLRREPARFGLLADALQLRDRADRLERALDRGGATAGDDGGIEWHTSPNSRAHRAPRNTGHTPARRAWYCHRPPPPPASAAGKTGSAPWS